MSDFEEIECKYLNIDVSELKEKIKALGGSLKFNRTFRSYVFDYPNRSLDKDFSWLRLRDEGDAVRLAFKQRLGVVKGSNDEGMKEVEVAVGDFEKTAEIFRLLGMEVKFYEEKRRTQYKIGNVEVCIDEWPLIPPYAEIEGQSWKDVDSMALKLGFKLKDKKIFSAMQVFKKYGINENDFSVLTFDKQIKK
jgi:adenylate cyclase class 2